MNDGDTIKDEITIVYKEWIDEADCYCVIVVDTQRQYWFNSAELNCLFGCDPNGDDPWTGWSRLAYGAPALPKEADND